MPGDRTRADAGRGQSSIDFVIGFAVFFLTFSFVITLIPELLSPFAAQKGPVVADRAVDTLSSDLLATATLGTLNESCTEAFVFNESNADCGAFDSPAPAHELLGLDDEHSLNVTLARNETTVPGTEVVCYDASEVLACSAGGARLARGPTPPGSTQSVRSARRVVRLDGETLFLDVRVW